MDQQTLDQELEEIDDHAEEMRERAMMRHQADLAEVATAEELSPAEKAWRKRRNRRMGITEQQSVTDITELDPILQRLAYVIEQILENAPEEIRTTWQFKTVAAMITEAKKDLRRLPLDQVEEMSLAVGNAFLWVAGGRMEDLQLEVESDSGGSEGESGGTDAEQGESDESESDEYDEYDGDDEDPFITSDNGSSREGN